PPAQEARFNEFNRDREPCVVRTLLSAAFEFALTVRGQECPRHNKVGGRSAACNGRGRQRLRLPHGGKRGRTAAEYPHHSHSRLRKPQPDFSHRATHHRRCRARIQRPHPVPCHP